MTAMTTITFIEAQNAGASMLPGLNTGRFFEPGTTRLHWASTGRLRAGILNAASGAALAAIPFSAIAWLFIAN